MNVADLLRAFRSEAKDAKLPYLWTDPELIPYAAQAEMEAARRTRDLFDDTTPAITRIAVVANTHTYRLDSRVLFVRRVRLASQPGILPKSDQRDLDYFNYGWEAMVSSPPCTWFPLGYRQMRLVPTPDVDDTLELQVIRLPLDPLTGLGDEPEINERFHPALVHWILYRAYGKQDSQANDPAKAKTALAEFEREFGPPSNARDEIWIAEKHGHDIYEGTY